MRIILLSLLIFVSCISVTEGQVVSTIAGSTGVVGNINGNGTSARFNNPHGIAADKLGNVYIADRYNNLIRKINSSGVVSTFAGTGSPGSNDGPGNVATFNEPWGVTCDTLGNVYIADTKSYKIRKINSVGVVSTIAGTGVFGTTNGANSVAKFGFSSGITVTPDGNTIYVADYNTHVIRKIFNGQTTTFAGTVYVAGAINGLGLAATFNHPYGIELDNNFNIIVADEWNNILRKITPAGLVTTFAGQGLVGSIDGTALASQFNYPWDVTIDAFNNIFILDGYNFTIRKISSAGAVTTYVGTPGLSGSVDGTGAAARFNNAAGITFNTFDKCLYVADCNNHLIRKVSFQSPTTISLTNTGNSSLCFGDSLHLNASPSGLTNYTFKEGTTIVGSSANGVVSIAGLSSGSHILTCTAYDSNGALASSNTVTVTVLPVFTPVISSSNGTSLCQGDSVKLSAPIGSSYLWSNNSTTQNIYVTTAGSFSVTVTNSSGCKGISSPIVITTQTSPIATITSTTTTICPNDSLQLTASIGSSWIWSTGATTQTIKVPAGSYFVTVTNAFGCSTKSTTIAITNFSVSIPTITPTGIVTIFQGDSILLTANGGSNYQWSNAQTGNSVYIKTAGNYFVNSIGVNGCNVSSIPVQVIVIASSSLLTANGVTSFCEGNNVQLSSLFPTGNQWFYNGLAINGATSQQYLATDSGYYKVGISQTNGVIYSDSILVTVFSAPQLANVSDTSVCKGTVVDLQIPNVNGNSFSWFTKALGGTSFLVSDNYQTPPVTSSVSYFIESIGANGCRSLGRAVLNVDPLPTPICSFTTTTTPQSGLYPTVFLNSTTNADSQVWYFGDTTIAGNVSYNLNPVYTYQSTGDFNVILISKNINGCSDSIFKTVNIHNNNSLFIPTTFSPNGDGKNDIFRVRGDQFSFQEMKIYDQWGTLIYCTDASRPDWDGKVNGENVQNATYVYRIRILDQTNITKELTGSITVIR